MSQWFKAFGKFEDYFHEVDGFDKISGFSRLHKWGNHSLTLISYRPLLQLVESAWTKFLLNALSPIMRLMGGLFDRSFMSLFVFFVFIVLRLLAEEYNNSSGVIIYYIPMNDKE
ncbi:MAG: hypothetical protein DWQ04_32105 [Chloroflexi bacterium]|nr:MAG: hypothetical protein DWQ04_32105 [Chloroflexota bacterium]